MATFIVSAGRNEEVAKYVTQALNEQYEPILFEYRKHLHLPAQYEIYTEEQLSNVSEVVGFARGFRKALMEYAPGV